jgi:hypothetical protein
MDWRDKTLTTLKVLGTSLASNRSGKCAVKVCWDTVDDKASTLLDGALVG